MGCEKSMPALRQKEETFAIGGQELTVFADSTGLHRRLSCLHNSVVDTTGNDKNHIYTN
jgi:hypothetical protein